MRAGWSATHGTDAFHLCWVTAKGLDDLGQFRRRSWTEAEVNWLLTDREFRPDARPRHPVAAAPSWGCT